MGNAAAFFDLDKTLLSVNSGKLWMMHEYRVGRIGWPKLLEGSLYILMYKFGVVDMNHAMTRAVTTVMGMTEDEIRRGTEDWWDAEVKQHVMPGAHETIAWHKQQGHRTILHTSSSPYVGRCAVRTFALDDFLSSRFEVVDGRLTGRFEQPLCYHEGKVHYARRYAASHDIDLSKSYFYTDSNTDLPMLEAVGQPRIINPDPRLARIARKRDWTIGWGRQEL